MRYKYLLNLIQMHSILELHLHESYGNHENSHKNWSVGGGGGDVGVDLFFDTHTQTQFFYEQLLVV